MKTITIAVLLPLLSSSLPAANITVTGFDLNRTMPILFNLDGEERVAGAGVMTLSLDDSTVIDSLCADLFEGVNFYETYAALSINATDYLPTGGAAAWLLATYLPSLETAVEGAALQLAIWDVLHDGGDGFNAGRIQASEYTDTSVLELSQEWVTASGGKSSTLAYVFVPPSGGINF